VVNYKYLHVRFDSGVHQLLRRLVHGVFAFAAFDVLLCCFFRQVRVRLFAPRVDDNELLFGCFYSVFMVFTRRRLYS
jgi:hypothetical protein